MQTYLRVRCERGATAIMIALLLGIFVALVALVIDVGYGLIVEQQLQNVSDAAALHATRQLGLYYEALSDYEAQQNFVLSAEQAAAIRNAAIAAAADNEAGGQSIALDPTDIRIGVWDNDTKTLTETNTKPTAVEVLSRRDTTANGPISTFFARIMGIDNLNIASIFHRNNRQEIPTAALTGVGYVAPGELELPIGIASQWFENQEVFCDQPIRFYPTNDPAGCAGWHTFETSPSNASTLSKDILEPMLDGTFEGPEAFAGQTQFNFSGGNVANALSDLRDVYNDRKNAAGEWETYVVVYESEDCSNPSGLLTIVGFAPVTVTNVLAPPDGQLVEAKVTCEAVQPNARGGGSNYGALGSIPGLVQ